MRLSASQNRQDNFSVTKPLATLGIVVAAAAAVILSTAYIARLWIAEKIILNIAADQGLQPLSLEVSRLDSSSITVENISGPNSPFLIERLEIDFAWRELFDRRLKSVLISRGQFNLNPGDLALNFTELTTLGDESEAPEESLNFQFERVVISDTSVNLQWNQDVFVLELGLNGLKVQNGWDTNFSGLLQSNDGALQVDWKGIINLEDFTSSNGSGRIEFDVNNYGTPEDVDALGSLTATLNDRKLELDILRPLTFRSRTLPSEIFDYLPSEFMVVAQDDVELTISGNRSAAIYIRESADDYFAGADISAELDFGPARITTHLKGELTAQKNGRIDQFLLESLESEIIEFPLYGGTLNGALNLNEVRSPISETNIPLELKIDFRTPQLAGIQIDRVEGEVFSDVRFKNSRLQFELENSRFSVTNFRAPSTIDIPGSITLSLGSTKHGLPSSVSVPLGVGPESPIEIDIAGSLSTFSARLEATNFQDHVEITFPRVRFSGLLETHTEDKTLNLYLDSGSVEHLYGTFSDVSADLFVRNDTYSGTSEFRIDRIGDVQFESSAQQLDLRAVTTFQQKPGVNLVSGGLKAHDTSAFGKFFAQVKNDGTSGELTFEIPRTQLGSEGSISASMVSAFFPVTDLGGVAGLRFDVDWDDSGIRHSGAFNLENGRIASPHGVINGMSTKLTLESLWPPQR